MDFFEILIDVEVKDVKHLTNIIAALRATPHINSVERARGSAPADVASIFSSWCANASSTVPIVSVPVWPLADPPPSRRMTKK